MGRSGTWLLVLLCLAAPSVVHAQASITGTIRDQSGGVLPGVTVEAASPVLIEKARVAVSDAAGRYRVVDLRPGTYVVTFTLPGFNTVRRENVVLEGSFTATVDADLKVGSLQETITVTSESPIVDVQSVKRQTVIDNELINAIPAARSYAGLMQLMPNTTYASGASSDIQVSPGMVVFGSAGGRINEGRLQLNGLSVGSAFNGAGVSGYIADVGNSQEVVMTNSGGLGETEVGGPTLNIVPKEGGNRLSGQVYVSGAGDSMIGTNHDDVDVSRGQIGGSAEETTARRFPTPGGYTKVYDVNAGVGGPIARDKIWYFASSRQEGYQRTVPGIFANKNAGDPTKWLFDPDTSRQAAIASSFRTFALRLTSQVGTKNKFSVFWDEQRPCDGAALTDDADACRHQPKDKYIIAGGASPTISPGITPLGATAPEASGYRDFGQRVQQAKWTSPVSSKMLLEAAWGTYRSALWGGKALPGGDFYNLIRVTEQCGVRGCAANGGIPNLSYRSPRVFKDNLQQSMTWNTSVSYVVGPQSLKFGYMGSHLSDNRQNIGNSQMISYRTNNGIPDQITEYIDEIPTKQRVVTHAAYAQDQWTFGRITFSGALRYDHASSYYPDVTLGPVRFLPTPLHFDRTVGVEGYNDLSPRGGVAIDVFGTGKTSVKFNMGRYLEAAQNGGLFTAKNPTNRLAVSTTRTWIDADADWVADCDLSNRAAQGPATAVYGGGGQDFCSANLNQNFGTPTAEQNLDPRVLSGWGVRAGDWQVGAALQHELMPRVSVEIGYQRRWLTNFVVTDNLAVGPEQYTFFDVFVPADPRLPNSGGYTVSGVSNITQAGAGVINDNQTTSLKVRPDLGEWNRSSNAINFSITARPKFGLVVQGGFNTGQTHEDFCDLKRSIPELTVVGGTSPANPWCDTTTAWTSRYTGLGSYTIPWADVLVAATFRSDQGAELAANWAVAASNTNLGRPFASNAQNITVNIIEPGTLYGDRINELDFAVSKLFRFGGTRTKIGVDIYNITNSNPVLSYDQNINFTGVVTNNLWLRPSSVLQPRFFKMSAQVNF
jgi:hypothetical protein